MERKTSRRGERLQDDLQGSWQSRLFHRLRCTLLLLEAWYRNKEGWQGVLVQESRGSEQKNLRQRASWGGLEERSHCPPSPDQAYPSLQWSCHPKRSLLRQYALRLQAILSLLPMPKECIHALTEQLVDIIGSDDDTTYLWGKRSDSFLLMKWHMNSLLLPTRLIVRVQVETDPHCLGPCSSLFLGESLFDDYIAMFHEEIDLVRCLIDVR